MQPRVEYGMSWESYAAAPGVSQSALKKFAESPLTYWTYHLSDQRPVDEDKEHFAWGRAAHARILEGREAFVSRFCTDISRDDFPEYLASGDDLKARCEELGLAKSGTLAAMSARIKAADPDALLWVDKQAEHDAIRRGRRELKAEHIRQIETVAMALEMDDSTRELLTGGMPEVSVFWEYVSEDGRHRVPCKARFDYLKGNSIVDIKKFANQRKRPIREAVVMDILNYRYDIQAVMYREAYKAAAKMSYVPNCEPNFTFLFIQSGPVANVLARGYGPLCHGERNSYYCKAELDYHAFMREFSASQKQWPNGEPWVEPVEVVNLDDDEFPIFAL